jgi:hypothetical protein
LESLNNTIIRCLSFFFFHPSLFDTFDKSSITCLPIEEYVVGVKEYMEEKKKDIQKDTLKPVTKVNSQLDKELQEWEVESTESG